MVCYAFRFVISSRNARENKTKIILNVYLVQFILSQTNDVIWVFETLVKPELILIECVLMLLLKII